jgi:hypothetical protein
MQSKILSGLCVLVMFVAISCNDAERNAVQIGVDFKWNPPCTELFVSPEITIKKVPDGTTQFYVEMTDLDLPAFDHGGGFVKYENQNVIPAGAVRGSYAGPSPPYGIIHTYEIKVRALGPNKEILGVGKAAHQFPPEGEEEIRWMPCNRKGD